MLGIIITPKEELCLLFYYTKWALFPNEDNGFVSRSPSFNSSAKFMV